jgi:hypothetical protein
LAQEETMSEVQQARFDGWAIVDVLGHQRYVGYVTTEAYGGAVLFRIDVPELAERERVSKSGEYAGGRWVPAGTTVKEGAVQGYTKLIGAGSIYAITPCSQEAALKAVENTQQRPLMSVALPPERALASSDVMSVECPVCHSTASPCECDMAEDNDPDFDDEASA